MYKGKLCASTTYYNDQTKASCGCGPSDPVPKDWWTLTKYTAALNCMNLDADNPANSWCPQQCGACYRLCSTGGEILGNAPDEGVCQVFKITNRCGDGYKEYPMWCSQEMSWQQCQANPSQCSKKKSTNWYGYPAHFDLMTFYGQTYAEGAKATGTNGSLDWNNPEVTFEPVPCSEWEGPAWNCDCAASEAVGI